MTKWFYSVTWQDGDFSRTAAVLAFDSRAARDAYQMHSPQMVTPIPTRQKDMYLREGRRLSIALWDAATPTKFTIVT
jgi:hypothetical protein